MITTFLTDSELIKFSSVSDKELNELLKEVRDTFDNKFYVEERKMVKSNWFGKNTSTTLYNLYAHLNGAGEVQEVNFCRDWEYSINTLVPKSYIMAYFFGLLSGANFEKHRYDNP